MSVMDRSPGPQILFDLRKSFSQNDCLAMMPALSMFRRLSGIRRLDRLPPPVQRRLRQTFCGLIYMPTYWSRLAEVTFHRSIFRGV